MPQDNQKTCFIAAPFGFDTAPLMQAIAERGLATSRMEDVEPGKDIITSVLDQIKRADMVCAVLPAGYSHEPIVFELGLAYGLNRPILLFIEPDVKMPLGISNLNYVTTSLTDLQMFGKALDSLLANLDQTPPNVRRSPTHKVKTLSKTEAARVRTRLKDYHTVAQRIVYESSLTASKKPASHSPPRPHRREASICQSGSMRYSPSSATQSLWK